MNSLTRFIRSSGIFFIGNVLSKIITFLLLPIYTAYIPSEGFGYYDLSITYVYIVSSITYVEIWTSVMRFLYDANNEEHKTSVVLSGGSIFAASTIVFIAVGFAISRLLDFRYVYLILVYGVASNVTLFYSCLARGLNRNVDFAISGIINTFVMATSNIVMIVVYRMDYSCLYIAAILGSFSQVAYLEARLRILRTVSLSAFDSRLTKELLLYTLPLCVNSVAYWLLTSYNRVAISRILSVADNGMFAVGNKFAGTISLVTTCFTYAWQDVSFSRKHDDPGNGIFFSKACEGYLWLLAVGGIVLIPLIGSVYPFLVDESYSASRALVPLSIMVAVAGSYSIFVGNIFYAIKDTRAIFVSMVISGAVNLVLCNWLIRTLGLNGANLSILISFVVNVTIRDRILHHKLGFRTNLLQVALVGLGFAATAIVFYRFGNVVNISWAVVCAAIASIAFRRSIAQAVRAIAQRASSKC